ncbi:hypothetical protein [Paenibacillus ginsengarvi]|uniref:hypothetical protein n=1 Tax=Paenibacillus ginsengarvi TaxID=400777 RepID=UPI0013150C12|nr:hypothetical protein [Paenibacillus ginsengarvi]
MIVFDVVYNGAVQETLRPSNQNRTEMYWFLVDRIPVLQQKYGSLFTVYRRTIQE